MATNNMNNLTTLIKRLEAATSRLEDIASSSVDGDEGDRGISPAGTATPAGKAAAASTSSLPVDLPQTVQNFELLITNHVKPFSESSKKLGGPVGEMANAVNEAFAAVRQYIFVATKAKKPDATSTKYMEVLQDLQQAIEKANSIRSSKNAPPEVKNHLFMVSDGLGSLGWITMERSPRPADYVTELFGGAQIYGNKILKEYKDKDAAQVNWVKSFYAVFQALLDYIREEHNNGVQWNAKGIDVSTALREVKSLSAPTLNGSTPKASTPAPSAGGPPPPPPLPNFDSAPPPPPPPPPKDGTSPMSGPGSGGANSMDAVFDQLNRGSDVTKGLRKVDASQMTHKNPSLRATSTSSDPISRGKSPTPPGKKPKPESMRTKKPPRTELDGNKWYIEHHENTAAPITIDASIAQSILISRCKSTTVRIRGKANAIAIDNCARLNLILDSLVSSVDVIKSPNFALQVLGSLPTVLLDQVDGAALYLSRESLKVTEVFLSKCTSVNVNLPPEKKKGGEEEDEEEDSEEEEAGDFREEALPEQIRSFYKDGKMVSEIVEHAG